MSPRHHQRRDSPSPLISNLNSEHSTYLWPKSGGVCAGFQPHSDDKEEVTFTEQPPVPVPKRKHGIELRFHSCFLQHLPRCRVRKVLTGVNQTFVKYGTKEMEYGVSCVCVWVCLAIMCGRASFVCAGSKTGTIGSCGNAFNLNAGKRGRTVSLDSFLGRSILSTLTAPPGRERDYAHQYQYQHQHGGRGGG